MQCQRSWCIPPALCHVAAVAIFLKISMAGSSAAGVKVPTLRTSRPAYHYAIVSHKCGKTFIHRYSPLKSAIEVT